MEFGPLGGFGLKLFSGNGLRLFSRGRGKKGVAGGASVEGAGVGWDCPGASKCLFFRSRMRLGAVQRSLDCRLRRNDTCWISACAGRTLWPPHPAVPWAPPASPAVGRGVLDCCLRRNDTGAPSPGGALGTAGLSRKGRGGLGSCLRRNDTGTPSPGGALGTAGLSRGGERRTGFPLAQEGHWGPLTRRCLGHRRPLPQRGRGGLGSRLRRNDTGAPSPGGALGTAGLSRGGERRTGFPLAQE